MSGAQPVSAMAAMLRTLPVEVTPISSPPSAAVPPPAPSVAAASAAPSPAAPAATVTNRCAQCGAAGSKRCGRCHERVYCSAACQQRDWPKHRSDCVEKKNKKTEEEAVQCEEGGVCPI